MEHYTPLSSTPYAPSHDSSFPSRPQLSTSQTAFTQSQQSAFPDPPPTVPFSEEECRESNCRVIKNRKQLDAVRLSLVLQLTYQLYPIESGKSEEGDWNKTCVKAIDEIKCLYTCTVELIFAYRFIANYMVNKLT